MRRTSRQWLVAGLVAAMGAGALVFGGLSGDADTPPAADRGAVSQRGGEQDLAARQVAAAAPGNAAPLDPLTTGEIQKAQDLAATAAANQIGAASPSARQRRPEPLFADHRVDKTGKDRLADVFLYDYAGDRGVHAVVNLSTGKVENVVSKPGLQPPPSEAETTRAVQILMDDRRLGPKLRQMYKTATGQDLGSPNDVWSQALIFKAKQSTGIAGALRAGECGKHRCVQLFVRVPGGKWVDTSRLVVDLSARRVLALG